MRAEDVPGVLRRHGLDPAASVAGLTAELAARGWVVALEEMETSAGNRPAQRWRALATRTRPAGAARTFAGFPEHLQGRGPTEAEALARVLASALVHDEG